MAKNVVEEFVALLGWEVDSKELEKFNGQVKDVTGAVKKVVGAIAAATGALTALVTVTNMQTAVNTTMARSFGIAAEEAENWGMLLSAIGLEASAVTRLMKDMSVRIGQASSGIGDAATIKDAAKAINIEFETLTKLAPEKQYLAILNAAKESTDQNTALAAAQQLMGRQGAIIVGFLRQQKGTVEEILELQGRINVQTEEGRMGALRFFFALDDVGNAVSSIKALFAGLVGEQIAPFMEEFNAWVRANRELIRINIKKWVMGFVSVLKVFGTVIKWIWERIKQLLDLVGGLNKAMRLLVSLFAAWLSIKTLAAIGTMLRLIQSMGAAQALLAAKTALVNTGMALLRTLGTGLFALILEDIWTFIQGGDSLIGRLNDVIQPAINDFLDSTGRMFASWMGIRGKEYDVLMQKLLSGFDALPGKIRNRLSFIRDDLVRIFNKLQLFFFNVGNSVINFFQPIIDKITKGLQTVRNLLPKVNLQQILPAVGIPNTAMVQQGAANLAQNVSNISSRVNNNNQITINQQPGQSSQDVAQQVGKQIAQQTAVAARNLASGETY